MRQFLKEVSKVVILGGVLVAFQAIAFTEAPCAPPNCNVPAPVNVGDVSQTKSGGLTVGSLASLGSAFLATNSGNVGIGTVSPVQKLQVVGGKAQADDFCLNSNPSQCLGSSGSISYTSEYCWGNPQPPEVTKFGPCSPGGTPSPGVKMILASQGVCFITYYVDGSNGGPSGVFIGGDGYWYLSGGWPYFSHRARCIILHP